MDKSSQKFWLVSLYLIIHADSAADVAANAQQAPQPPHKKQFFMYYKYRVVSRALFSKNNKAIVQLVRLDGYLTFQSYES